MITLCIFTLLTLGSAAAANDEVTFTVQQYDDPACEGNVISIETITWPTNACFAADNETYAKVTACLTDVSGFTLTVGDTCDELTESRTFTLDECTESEMILGDFSCDINLQTIQTNMIMILSLGVGGLVIAGVISYFACRKGRTPRK